MYVSVKIHGGEVVKDFAEYGAKPLLHQAGRGSKRRHGQRSNLSTTKRFKLCSYLAVPRRTKWITKHESSHDDKSDGEQFSCLIGLCIICNVLAQHEFHNNNFITSKTTIYTNTHLIGNARQGMSMSRHIDPSLVYSSRIKFVNCLY